MEGIVKGKASYNTKGVLCLILEWFIILLFAVYTLFPLLWLLITSLKTNAEYLDDPFSLPAVPQFQNYINAFSQVNLGQVIQNSVAAAVIATAANVFVAAMASYAIFRFDFKGKEIFFTIFSAGVVVPLSALMVPHFTIFSKIGPLDSMNVLQILYTVIGLPAAVIIIRGFMDSLPREIEEAAYIDGRGFFRHFFQIILSLSKTGLITAVMFQFITCRNEFIYTNLLALSLQNKTIQVGIRYFTNQFTTDYVSMCAVIIIAIVPSVLRYVLSQEQAIFGTASGVVKG